jgi:hypothetical protein
MTRKVLLGTLLVVTSALATCLGAASKHKETTDPAEAQKDPDFAIQGEYRGEGLLSDQSPTKIGAQVIALSQGEFTVVVYRGGLPGDGWCRGDQRFHLNGRTADGVVQLTPAAANSKLEGKIADGKLTLAEKDGPTLATLLRVERQSPTLGAQPSQDALVLFNGSDAANFPGAQMTAEKNLEANATSIKLPPDYRLHLEFRLSYMPTARGQARSNSGLYLHDCYEVQVLDSFGLEGANNECGGFYKIQEPAVNMCLPPLVWQTYDVDFTAPRYDASGTKVTNARITVCHNGVIIHNNLELPAATPGRQKEGPAPRPLFLQGHGNHVQYRNIWIVEKK